MEAFFAAVAAILLWLLRSAWFWGIVGLAVLVFILVLIYRSLKIRALESLEYTRSFSCDGLFAGESLILEERVHNPTLLPLFGVKLQFFVPAGLTVDGVECKKYIQLTSVFHIPPLATVKKSHTVRADLRGHIKMTSAAVRYRDSEFVFSVPLELHAYPNYNVEGMDVPPELYFVGERISNRKYIEDPFLFSGVRPYQMGDSERSVNFKVSARSFSCGARALMSNSYDSSRHFDSMIFLDLFDYPSEHGEIIEPKVKLENGLRYACFLLFETVRQGGSVGFASNCFDGEAPYINIPCGEGDLHTKRILEALAEMSEFARRDYSINALLARFASRAEEGTDIYLITPHTDDKTDKTLRMLENMGLNICVIPLSVGGESQ